MADKTITDLGSANAEYSIVRDAGDVIVEVLIRTDDGDTERVGLSRDDVIAATTAADRAATVATLDKLYAAALAKRGFA